MLLFNKKGQITMMLFVGFILLLVGVLFILVGGLVSVKTHEVLNQDIDIGNVNLKNVTADSFGQFNTMFINSADWWGLSIIFGMVLGLFLSAYILRNTMPKWGIVIDIFIIVSAFIFCLYLSSAYGDLLNALASADETFLEDYAPKTSMFVLNLHIFCAIIGSISMFLFHSSIPRKSEEKMQSGGYLRGV